MLRKSKINPRLQVKQLELFKDILNAVRSGQQVQTFTLVDAPLCDKDSVGQMLSMFSDGRIQGCLIDEEFTARVVESVKDQDRMKPQLIDIDNGKYRVFWDQVAGKPQAVILGGGHISQPLVEMLHLVGYHVTVIDDRLEYANAARFPHAARVICDSFGHVGGNAVINCNTAVILMTRGHRYDLDCLRATIDSPAFYIGMIGSRRRVKAIIQTLQGEGVSAERLQRLRAPIGLDIGAQTPAEIALSVAAEVLYVSKGGTCLPLGIAATCFGETEEG